MSRLEEIKAKPYFNKETRTDRVNSADIVWLIKRVEELEKFKREAEYLYKNYHLSAKKSAEEKERYKQALERIAYDDEVLSNTEDIVIAREALEQEKSRKRNSGGEIR